MTPEKRKPLTRRHFALLCLNQKGKCPSCGNKLDLMTERQTVDEHIQPLFSGGSNDLENRAIWCADCAKEKTRKEAPENARVRRHSGATSSQYSRRKAQPKADKPKAKLGWKPDGYKHQWPKRGFGK